MNIKFFQYIMDNNTSSAPICQNVKGELNCYLHYIKCPIKSVHIVPERTMKKHLRKVHNLDRFEPGLYGADFDDRFFRHIINSDVSSTVPICQNKDGELSCYTFYMKCPIDYDHVVPERRMKKHLQKVHNLDKFEPGLYGVGFDDHLFWFL